MQAQTAAATHHTLTIDRHSTLTCCSYTDYHYRSRLVPVRGRRTGYACTKCHLSKVNPQQDHTHTLYLADQSISIKHAHAHRHRLRHCRLPSTSMDASARSAFALLSGCTSAAQHNFSSVSRCKVNTRSNALPAMLLDAVTSSCVHIFQMQTHSSGISILLSL